MSHQIMPDLTLNGNCGLCSGRIVTEYCSDNQFQAEVLKKWNQKCISSFCQTLQLDKTFLNKNLCSNCDQLTRDMEFLVRNIDRFQKKLNALKAQANAILAMNPGREVNFHTKKADRHACSFVEASASFDEDIKPECTLNEIDPELFRTNTDSNDHNYKTLCNNRYPKRNRVSRYPDKDEEFSIETEIKHEPDSDAMNIEDQYDDDDSWNEACDPDFTVDSASADNNTTARKKRIGRKSVVSIRNCTDPGFNLESEIGTLPMDAVANAVNTSPKKKYSRKTLRKPAVVKHERFYCKFPNCGEHFRKPSSLEFHVSKFHENDPTPYKCPDCDLKLPTSRKYFCHRVSAHGLKRKLYPCPKCDRTFLMKKSVKDHDHLAHPPTSGLPKCSICLRHYPSEEDLQTHVELHNNLQTTDTPFACVICNVDCVGLLGLQAHARIHDDRFIKCTESGCNKVFNSKVNLKGHIRRKHNLVLKPHSSCPKCKYIAQGPKALVRHMSKHIEGKQFKCEHEGCGKAFKHKGSRQFHYKMVHAEQTPQRVYQCSLCPKTYKVKNHLVVHETTHSSERPFLCDQCPSGFKTLHNLQGHRRVHAKHKKKEQEALQLEESQNSNFQLSEQLMAFDERSFQKNSDDIGFQPQENQIPNSYYPQFNQPSNHPFFTHFGT